MTGKPYPLWLTINLPCSTISVMSVKGFLIAILCVIAGGFGFYYSMMGIMNTTDTPTGWIVLLIISVIAIAFGTGVLANRIKF